MGQTCSQYCGKDGIETSELLTVDNKVGSQSPLTSTLFIICLVRADQLLPEGVPTLSGEHTQDHPSVGVVPRDYLSPQTCVVFPRPEYASSLHVGP